MTHWETLHTFKTARLTIETSIAPEDWEPDWDFETEEERQEVLDKIDRGILCWFQVRVRVLLDHKFEIGTAYLGGCCYENAQEFLTDGYWRDMVRGASREARNYLTKYRTPLIVRAA